MSDTVSENRETLIQPLVEALGIKPLPLESLGGVAIAHDAIQTHSQRLRAWSMAQANDA